MTDFPLTLEAEARRFCQRNQACGHASQQYLVFDLEYEYDDARHHAYRTAEGFKDSEEKVRWPFHRIRAASWLILEIVPSERVPRFGDLVVMTAESYSESEIVSTLFEQFRENAQPTPVTWGGEAKDLTVLRRCACEFDLVLPVKLRDLRPHSRDRIDLCLEVAGGSANVHLPEYAAATSIPAKPSPSKSVGSLVKSSRWDAVEEQVRADVLTTTVILLRHIASRSEADIDPTPSVVELAASAHGAAPRSRFIAGTLGSWARGLKNRAALKGTVYRLSA